MPDKKIDFDDRLQMLRKLYEKKFPLTRRDIYKLLPRPIEWRVVSFLT